MAAGKLRRPQFNPIIVRELRVRMRGARPYLVLTVFLLLLSLMGYGVIQLMVQQSRMGSVMLSAQVGQALFNILSFGVLALVVFLAPAMTSSAISGEREQMTYEMLLATPLQPARILRGKLLAALSYLFLLIFATLPIFSVVFMFGGVTVLALLNVLALLTLSALTFGTIGLFCSALFRRTARATIISYGLILIMLAATILPASFWPQFSNPPGQSVPPPWLYLNPFSALVSMLVVVPSMNSGPFFAAAGDFLSALPLMYLFSNGVVHYGPMGAEVIPIYRASLLFFPLLTLLLYWFSVHLVLPFGRWRPRRADFGFLLALLALLALIWFSRDWWFVEPPPMV
jgi:ABC-type transport system involved in multi-copper enzyme maturation permease subunit